jgi:hypothetical protein
MDADFSIELGREDPVLDFPWQDRASKFFYVDLKRHPELLCGVEEAKEFPELAEFLKVVNSFDSMLETAKSDAWATTELSVEEEIYDASHKFASYIDVVFSNADRHPSPPDHSLPRHEQFARDLVEVLRRPPQIPSSAEVCVRRCYFAENTAIREGFYCTLYINGYGNDGTTARRNWGLGLKRMSNAILQLSASAPGLEDKPEV